MIKNSFLLTKPNRFLFHFDNGDLAIYEYHHKWNNTNPDFTVSLFPWYFLAFSLFLTFKFIHYFLILHNNRSIVIPPCLWSPVTTFSLPILQVTPYILLELFVFMGFDDQVNGCKCRSPWSTQRQTNKSD